MNAVIIIGLFTWKVCSRMAGGGNDMRLSKSGLWEFTLSNTEMKMRICNHLNTLFVVPQQLFPHTACLSVIWCIHVQLVQPSNITKHNTFRLSQAKWLSLQYLSILPVQICGHQWLAFTGLRSKFKEVMSTSYPINTTFGLYNILHYIILFYVTQKNPQRKQPYRHTRGDTLTSRLLQYHIWAPYQSGFRGKIMATITRSEDKVK